jgi:hypothetical protein
MNYRTLRRLERLEEELGWGQRASEILDAFDTLSEEDRGVLLPYLEARKNGEAEAADWPNETHRAMNRYLRACVAQSKAMREACVPMPSIIETLQRCRAARVAF